MTTILPLSEEGCNNDPLFRGGIKGGERKSNQINIINSR
jgi:hypothetical protein